MNLIILHYHLRPGGVRRVIELATPFLLGKFKDTIQKVVLATGEADDDAWNKQFRTLAGRVPVEFFVEPTFGYFSELKQPPDHLRIQIRAKIHQLLGDANGRQTVVWAHNLGIARNLILTRELGHACDQLGVKLLSQHHDWWCENRWLRWPEMRRSGCATLTRAATAIFPPSEHVHHLAINQCDTKVLQKHLGGRVSWLPNLARRIKPPAKASIKNASNWIRARLGGHDGPIWILPCRLLRRKNMAEALLLTRWLRPEAWLVTTGGVSSADELSYAKKLEQEADKNGWRLRLGVLGEPGNQPKPQVFDLMAASECVIFTSIQEGFGLPYLEAAAMGRPLIARNIPNIAPDLKRFGFKFPQSYEEILVSPELFDWKAEVKRQQLGFGKWKAKLPRACQLYAGIPTVLQSSKHPFPVPFSRLTLIAQMEILKQPAGKSLSLCAKLNSFLETWRMLAAEGCLKTSSWPDTADRWLSGQAYAQRWADAVTGEFSSPDLMSINSAQNDLIRLKVASEQLFPLLWSAS